jgi:PAS domain S-box-containing protein
MQIIENLTEEPIIISSDASNVITEEKPNYAEQKLKQSERRLKLLLNNTAQGIYGVDMEGNFSFANAASLRMLGYKKEEDIIGKHVHSIIHHTRPDGSHYPATECSIYKTLYDPKGAHVSDECFWHSSGNSFPVEYWSFPIIDEGKIIGAVATFFNISDRKTAETERIKHLDAIELQNKKLREIAWIQSHIVREPLARMMGIVNVLKDTTLNTLEFKEWVNHFINSSNELDSIIHDISRKTRDVELD